LIFKPIEVFIPVLQGVAFQQAKCADPTINCLAYGNSSFSEFPKVHRCSFRHLRPTTGEEVKLEQLLLQRKKILVVPHTLQNLAKYQVNQSDLSTTDVSVQPLCLGVARTLQVIHPHGGIHDNHGRTRSSTTPGFFQVPFPLYLPAEPSNALLPAQTHQQPQAFFYGCPFGSHFGAAHGSLHQLFIDLYVCPHKNLPHV
jgi:hypothetical protein